MISQITIELFKGAKKKIERIRYSDGTRVIRLYKNTTDIIPNHVIKVNKPFNPLVRSLMN